LITIISMPRCDFIDADDFDADAFDCRCVIDYGADTSFLHFRKPLSVITLHYWCHTFSRGQRLIDFRRHKMIRDFDVSSFDDVNIFTPASMCRCHVMRISFSLIDEPAIFFFSMSFTPLLIISLITLIDVCKHYLDDFHWLFFDFQYRYRLPPIDDFRHRLIFGRLISIDDYFDYFRWCKYFISIKILLQLQHFRCHFLLLIISLISMIFFVFLRGTFLGEGWLISIAVFLLRALFDFDEVAFRRWCWCDSSISFIDFFSSM